MLFEPQTQRWADQYAPHARPFIKALRIGRWGPDKYSFASDRKDYYNVLSAEDRGVVVRALVLLAQIEVKVKSFWSLLGQMLPHPSMSDLGIEIASIEVVHNEAYEKLLMVLGVYEEVIEELENPVVAGRLAYLNKHATRAFSDDRKQQIYSLILFSLFIENVSLFSQFYTILWFNRHLDTFDGQPMKDTANQVKYTRNEELLHAQAGIMIIRLLRKEYPEYFDAEMEAKIVQECHVAYAAEAQMIDWMLQGYDKPKLSAPLLKNYVADRLNQSLKDIGYAPQFPTDPDQLRETFWMVEGQFAPTRVDFFNSEATDYQVGNSDEDDDF